MCPKICRIGYIQCQQSQSILPLGCSMVECLLPPTFLATLFIPIYHFLIYCACYNHVPSIYADKNGNGAVSTISFYFPNSLYPTMEPTNYIAIFSFFNSFVIISKWYKMLNIDNVVLCHMFAWQHKP